MAPTPNNLDATFTDLAYFLDEYESLPIEEARKDLDRLRTVAEKALDVVLAFEGAKAILDESYPSNPGEPVSDLLFDLGELRSTLELYSITEQGGAT